jgi:hypothetical protein
VTEVLEDLGPTRLDLLVVENAPMPCFDLDNVWPIESELRLKMLLFSPELISFPPGLSSAFRLPVLLGGLSILEASDEHVESRLQARRLRSEQLSETARNVASAFLLG